jgi:hypothetical protein
MADSSYSPPELLLIRCWLMNAMCRTRPRQIAAAARFHRGPVDSSVGRD